MSRHRLARKILPGISVVLLSACSSSTQPTSAAPAVSVSFDGANSCTPLPNKACTLQVTATVTDPSADPLTYAWSGCATGSLSQANCTIDRLGSVQATVAVSDDHGHTASASAAGSGTDVPPRVQIGYIALLQSGNFDVLGNVVEPDEGGVCGPQLCSSPTTTSGACGTASVVTCTCLAGLEIEVQRTAPTGLCSVTPTLLNSWGQVGTPSFTFDVGTLKLVSVSGTSATTALPRNDGGR